MSKPKAAAGQQRQIKSRNSVPFVSSTVIDQLCKGSLILAEFGLETFRDVEKDWNAYSKTWHRNFGPKVTIDSWLRVNDEVLDPDRLTTNIVRDAMLVISTASPEEQFAKLWPKLEVKCIETKAIVLHPQSSAFELKHSKRYLYYAIFIGQFFYTYAIRCRKSKTIYHCHSYKELVQGLNAKIDKIANTPKRDLSKLWSFKKAINQFGFCEEGLADFCSLLKIERAKYYHFDEIVGRFDILCIDHRDYLIAQYRQELTAFGLLTDNVVAHSA